MFDQRKIAALSASMLLASGVDRSETITALAGEESGRQGLGLLDCVKSMFMESGQLPAPARPQEVVDLFINTLTMRSVVGVPQGAVTSDDLNQLLTGTAAASMRKGFTSATVTYPLLTQPLFVNDLKQQNAFTTSESSDALEVPEGTAPKAAMLTDTGTPIAMKNYGRGIFIGEEAIANDKLGTLTTCPARLGRGVQRRLNWLFWSRLLANPTMAEDGTAMFTAEHGNLMTGAALSESTFATACRAMLSRNLRSPDGDRSVIPGGIAPRFLAVGPSQALLAARLCGGDYQPVEGWKVTPVVDPLIESIGGGSPWFLFADPLEVDGAAVCYLKGLDTPKVRTRIGVAAEAKGLWIDVDIYADVIFTDWRFATKNPGA